MKKHLFTKKYLKFNNVIECADYLKLISTAKNEKIRKNLIKEAEDCVVNAISEIALNCLKGNIPLKNCDFKKLNKYKQVLRKISKRNSVLSRKKTILQSGGQLMGVLIPTAIALIEEVVRRLQNK